jgi:hypothetical protein
MRTDGCHLALTDRAGPHHLGEMPYHLFIFITLGALLGGCASPSPENLRSAVQAPLQNCAACIEENPGDVRVCEAICHEHEGDTASPWAGSVLR